MRPKDISFGTKIDLLQKANHRLFTESEMWKEKAGVESERALRVDEQFRQICEANQQLQEQVNRYSASIKCLKDMLSNCLHGLGIALPVLDKVKTEISLVGS